MARSWPSEADAVAPPSSTGATISPAPCALDIRNDHSVSSPRVTRIVVQRGCARGRAKRKIPKAISTAAAPTWRTAGSVTAPSTRTSTAMTTTAASWPAAIGRNDRTTARRSPVCKPCETANSHPIAGLRPW